MVDAANKNFSPVFKADHPNVEKSLREYMEILKRGYLNRQWLQREVKIRKLFAWEIQAKINVLKKAEAILQKRFGLHPERMHQTSDEFKEDVRRERKAFARRKIAILVLRREQRHLSVLLTRSPRGRRMNYMLDYSAWCLAEKTKEITGQPKWECVADLLSEYLPIEPLTAHQALKAHGRFAALRNDKKRFLQVIMANNLDNSWFGT